MSRTISGLRILSADIGGTNTRFALCEVDNRYAVRQGTVFRIATRLPDVDSFASFWAAFRKAAPAELAVADDFDAIALAVAGSVDVGAGTAVLPNIGWNIETGDLGPLGGAHLVNDFVAQGYALAAAPGTDDLQAVRQGPDRAGCIAMVGAGTGLGHCALRPADGSTGLWYTVHGSEAGHAAFAFHGERERAIEDGMLRLAGKDWLSNDDVVSGPGAERLHHALTGETVTAREALASGHDGTVEYFARFYGRACRNYCLNVFPVARLVISGGMAARDPHLVNLDAFRDEFVDAGEYRPLFEQIPVWLNTDQDIGIRGAAVYAARQLRSATED